MVVVVVVTSQAVLVLAVLRLLLVVVVVEVVVAAAMSRSTKAPTMTAWSCLLLTRRYQTRSSNYVSDSI
ncbi:hypothetical protein GUJ93_ZPchr0011g27714 [Zizania palustris]|uniref:Uncharacterized protein n=1 Tax=Zizania palustris TaxID=103762 RepID=A0A8J6BJB3_ZIZPA|nr:hypothetical protein GUJ93_ZPchr0011g27714 [Zizania palustris]